MCSMHAQLLISNIWTKQDDLDLAEFAEELAPTTTEEKWEDLGLEKFMKPEENTGSAK